MKESLQQKEFLKITKKIDEIKTEIEKPLGGILQYTPNQISKSFFSEKIEKVSQRDIDNATLFINSYFNQFKRLLADVKVSTFLNEAQKELFIGTIKTYCLKLILFKYSIYIEGEKGGYELNEKDKKQYLKNIERIETLVYGPKISENKKEVGDIISNLENTYNKNKNNDNISDEERNTFKNFLEKFPSSKETKEDIPDKNKLGKISQENLARLFSKGLKLYNIESKIIKITEKVLEPKIAKRLESEGDTEGDILYIPAINPETGKPILKEDIDRICKNFGYKDDVLKIKINKCTAIEVNIPDKEINIPSSANYYPVIRSLELLSHEIVTHGYTGVNKEKKFNIESDTYLELQEGVAMLNEKGVTTNIEEISTEPTIHHISTFIAENYNTPETNDLLKIYYKLTGKKNAETLAKNRTERVKRFHSNDEKGANRKDVVYRRGMLDVLEYIQSLDKNKIEDIKKLQKDIFNFYIGKLGKKELENAKELIEGFDITPESIILPADIGKILLWMIEKNSTNKKDIKITNNTLGENERMI